MAVCVLVAMGWGLSLKNKIAMHEQRLASIDAEIERLEPELEALRRAKATETALRTEVERQTARIAKERAVRWSQILVAIAERLPDDMWLTRLASPDSSRITLTGISTNRETIPNAIDSLSGSPYLDSVVLGSLTTDDTYRPGRTVIRHQLNAALIRGLVTPDAQASDAGKSMVDPDAAEPDGEEAEEVER
jgi:Tfp pilus assembly protein PilN